MKDIQSLLKQLDIDYKDISLYTLAFTHPSCNLEANTKDHDYDKLEFMGDAVLDFVSADLIYKLKPEFNEGLSSKLRSYIVKTDALASFANSINLAEYILIGKSVNRSSLNNTPKILENVFEALVGAIYLDLGFDRAYKFLESFLKNKIMSTDEYDLTDPKSRLQEEMQAEYREAVHYEVISEEGPAHDKTFSVQVMFNDIVLAKGTGKSKRKAEEDAAKNALAKRSV